MRACASGNVAARSGKPRDSASIRWRAVTLLLDLFMSCSTTGNGSDRCTAHGSAGLPSGPLGISVAPTWRARSTTLPLRAPPASAHRPASARVVNCAGASGTSTSSRRPQLALHEPCTSRCWPAASSTRRAVAEQPPCIVTLLAMRTPASGGCRSTAARGPRALSMPTCSKPSSIANASGRTWYARPVLGGGVLAKSPSFKSNA